MSSKFLLSVVAAAALALSLALGPAFALEREAEAEAPSELLSTELLIRGGGRLAWSAQGDRLAYDKAGDDGNYDLYLRDMSTGFERCLTCEFRDFRHAHALNPTWHPSGQYLVFQAQQHPKKLGFEAEQLASPERALWSDLWLVRADGKDYWQLTRASEQGSAVLDPHFSYEGETLLWSERTLARKGRWGTWRLRTAQLALRRGVPRLSKLAVPADIVQRGLVIAQGFTPDDRGILITAQLDTDPEAEALEVYRVSIGKASQPERLTRSRGGWHEYARYSPRSDVIAFTSDAELRRDSNRRRTELWLMKPDGSDKRRLTRFNDTEGYRSCSVDDFEWSPEGDQIVAQVLCGDSVGDGEPTEDIHLLQLSETLRRP